MSGSLLQLRNFGPGDTGLFSPDDMNLFYSKVPRCQNFAIEVIEQSLNHSSDYNETFSTDITSGPDLLSSLYLEITLPSVSVKVQQGGIPCIARYIDNLGEFLIEYIEISIAGQTIDRQHGRFMHFWNALTLSEAKRRIYNQMIGNVDILCKPPNMSQTTLNYTFPEYKLVIPLTFWFCRHLESVIPLCSLHSVPVQISGKIRNFDEIFITSPNVSTIINGKLNVRIMSECIFLGTIEQQFFLNNKLVYLIEQTQYNGDIHVLQNSTKNIPLNFSKAVKCILFAAQKSLYTRQKTLENTSGLYYNAINQWSNFGICAYNNYNNPWVFDTTTSETTYGNLINSAQIKIAGTDRTMDLDYNFYNKIQEFYHFLNSKNGICAYTFALNPMLLAPSGSANFTRMNNVYLNLTLNDTILNYGTSGGNTTNPTPLPSIRGYIYNNNYSLSQYTPSSVTEYFDIYIYALSYNWLVFNNGVCTMSYA